MSVKDVELDEVDELLGPEIWFTAEFSDVLQAVISNCFEGGIWSG